MRFLLFIVLVSALHGVEIEVKPSLDVNVTKQELKLLEEIYADHGVKSLNIPKVRKYVSENRVLSEAYLKKHTLSPKLLLNIQHKIENILAKEMLEEIENEVFIDDTIAKSFYETHKQEYTTQPTYSYTHYLFSTYKEAVDFYNTYVSNVEGIKMLKEITTQPIVDIPENLTYYAVKHKSNHKNLPKLLSPQFIENQYSVILITKRVEAKVLPFNKVGNKIKHQLFDANFEKLRNKVLAGDNSL